MPTGLKTRVLRPERVSYPVNRPIALRIRIDGDDVEAYGAVGVAMPLRQKQCGSANEFALFVNVDRKAGGRDPITASITNFDEDKAIAVAHDQIDFAQATAKIASDSGQAIALQKSIGGTFAIGA